MEAQHKEFEEFVHHKLEGEDESFSFERVAKDLLAGSLAGVANVVSGHPLDTVKVRMQMLEVGFLKCMKSMVAQEGPLSFYKGVEYPLYSVPIVNAVVFAAYESAKKMMGIKRDQELTLAQGLVAGAWAGFVNCIVVTPVELIKIHQQMEGIGKRGRQTSAWEITKKIYGADGIRGLYKANGITILRETFGWAARFASYETARVILNNKFESLSVVNDFIAGGFSGLVAWVAQYPQDIIKTKLQSDLAGTKYPRHKLFRDGGTIACTLEIWRKEGIRGYWTGFSACALRAVIANAFTFLAYEQAKSLLL